jgi:hypothetical protein
MMMRKTIQAAALMLAVSASAYAGIMQTPAPCPGEMQCPAASPSPQVTSTQQDGATTDGDMQFPVTAPEVALGVLQTALSLL